MTLEFTDWIDKFATSIYVIYIILVVLTYLICLFINAYDDYKKLLELSENRSGLLNQFEIDKKEKKHLQQQINNLNGYIIIIMSHLNEKDTKVIKNKISLYERMTTNESGNENS